MLYDRADSGRKLAEKLMMYQSHNPIVIGIPKGGMVVAAEIAQALGAPLDTIVVHQLIAPGQVAIGAVAPNGVRVLDRELINEKGIETDTIDKLTGYGLTEIQRKLERYRQDLPMPDIQGRVVIMVDDGLEDDLHAWAAVRSVKKLNPAKVVFATPTGAPEIIEALSNAVDDLVTLEAPNDFVSLARQYKVFYDVKDQDVIDLLQKLGMASSKA